MALSTAGRAIARLHALVRLTQGGYAASMSMQTPSLDPAAREAALASALADYSRKGWQVTSTSPGQAILQRRKRIGWFWNLVLTVVTGGLWLIVVIVRVVNRKTETRVLVVDAHGRVSER